MSDRINDVLAAIDAQTALCICGREIPEGGASLDYCSPACQYGYTGPRDRYRLGHGLPDGPTLNQQVTAALERTQPYQSDGDTMRWTPTMADKIRDFMKATTGQDLHPWQAQLAADLLEDRRRRAEQPPDEYPPPPDSMAADLARIQRNLDAVTDEIFTGLNE
ncbi:hypothetical protein [Glycomyces sp. NPDC048151]|uniref:hypothetical protein n=1 Tax=Glycomyces sp. NPDC048151 TaxID=3364002 RepID=UPI00371083C1